MPRFFIALKPPCGKFRKGEYYDSLTLKEYILQHSVQ